VRATVFDIHGYFAHFRRVYSTSTSLTYPFPPRTAIAGIIGAILGLDYGEYWDPSTPLNFLSESVLIGVIMKNGIRSFIQTENRLFTKSDGAPLILRLKGLGNPTQTSIEILTGEISNRKLTPISYRIIIASDNDNLIVKIDQAIKYSRMKNPISLGSAQMLGYINYVSTGFVEKLGPGIYKIHSVIPEDVIDELLVEGLSGIDIGFIDLVPVDMTPSRKCLRTRDYIYFIGGFLRVKVKYAYKYSPIDGSEEIYFIPL